MLPFLVVLLLCLVLGLPAGAEEPKPYAIPLRGTTAVLKDSATVEMVNPERILVAVPDVVVGAPGGRCQVLADASVAVEGADGVGVLVEYHPVPFPLPLSAGLCPYGTLYLISADEWRGLDPVYGPQEEAAAAQRIRVQRLLLP
jgi:hypothetical protein